MLSKQDLNSIWGDSLIEYSPSVVSALGLPEHSETFLEDVGLPQEADLEVQFSNEIVTLQEFATQNQSPSPQNGESLHRIGTDGGTQICLTQASGHVVSIEITGQLPQRFVNSSIEAFIECLGLFAQHRKRIAGLSDDEIDELVPSFEASVRSVDDDALGNPENWWAVIVEQMYDGLL